MTKWCQLPKGLRVPLCPNRAGQPSLNLRMHSVYPHMCKCSAQRMGHHGVAGVWSMSALSLQEKKCFKKASALHEPQQNLQCLKNLKTACEKEKCCMVCHSARSDFQKGQPRALPCRQASCWSSQHATAACSVTVLAFLHLSTSRQLLHCMKSVSMSASSNS